MPEHLRYLFHLPYPDKGGNPGLLSICKAITGFILPQFVTKELLVEKPVAYHSCGRDEDGKLAAAAAATLL